MAALRAQFDKIVKRGCFSTAKRSPRVKLDDAVFECFAGLPSTCTDEDLEDLLHFVMDVYQFNGVPVAIDEVDLDEVSMSAKLLIQKVRC